MAAPLAGKHNVMRLAAFAVLRGAKIPSALFSI
jgi:hypothetical protein